MLKKKNIANKLIENYLMVINELQFEKNKCTIVFTNVTTKKTVKEDEQFLQHDTAFNALFDVALKKLVSPKGNHYETMYTELEQRGLIAPIQLKSEQSHLLTLTTYGWNTLLNINRNKDNTKKHTIPSAMAYDATMWNAEFYNQFTLIKRYFENKNSDFLISFANKNHAFPFGCAVNNNTINQIVVPVLSAESFAVTATDFYAAFEVDDIDETLLIFDSEKEKSQTEQLIDWSKIHCKLNFNVLEKNHE